MTDSSSGDRDPVEMLAEEFLERRRNGETPALAEYLQRYPDLADEIREVFPALVLMEQADPASKELASNRQPPAGTEGVPGQLGDFRILREIGRGGMGIVYEAEQVSLGRRVALKVLPPQVQVNPRYLGRFEREAKSAARLHHTNIVPVYGVGLDKGVHYYAMQFIQGLGLDGVLTELKRLRDGKDAAKPETPPLGISAQAVAQSLLGGRALRPLPGLATVDHVPEGAAISPVEMNPSARSEKAELPRDEDRAGASSSVTLPGPGTNGSQGTQSEYWRSVAQVGLQVAEALAYAHAEGVLHRDIKPSNLMLDARGHVWVADFGLAKAASPGCEAGEDLTHTGDVVGTLRYMAPEAFDGKADARSDVYALGLTLYELAALQPAFAESDRHKLIKQVTTEEPARLRRLEPKVPSDLATIIHKAINREPGRRYQSAAETAADLRRFLEDKPIQARRTSMLEHGWRWCRRHPDAAILSVAVVLVALLGFIGMYWQMCLADASEAEARKSAVTAEENAALANTLTEQAKLLAADAEKQAAEVKKLNQHLKLLLQGSQINLAQAAWGQGNIPAIQNLLQVTQPLPGEEDLRGFEWHYLNKLCQGNLIRLPESELASYNILAFSADYRSLATCGLLVKAEPTKEEHLFLIYQAWDLEAAKELFRLDIPHLPHFYGGLAFSPDGKRLAVLDESNRIGVWEIKSGQQVFLAKEGIGNTVGLEGHHSRLRFSPDGKWIAAASYEKISLWDAQTGASVRTFPTQESLLKSDLAFSPDAKLLYGGTNVWNVADGKHVRKIKVTDGPSQSVFTPDCQFLITVGWNAVDINVWDTTTGKLHLCLKAAEFKKWSEDLFLAFSPEHWLLATCVQNSNKIKLWDFKTGELLRVLYGHAGEISSLHFNQDGKTLLALDREGTRETWDLQKHPEFQDVIFQDLIFKDPKLFDAAASGFDAVLSPDGLRLVRNIADRVEMWDARTGGKLFALPKKNGFFSADGKYLLTRVYPKGSATFFAEIWNAQNGQFVFRWEPAGGVGANEAAFAGNSKLLAMILPPHQVKIVNIDSGKELLIFEPKVPKGQEFVFHWPQFSRDGKWLALNSSTPEKPFQEEPFQMRILVFDAQNGRHVQTIDQKSGFFNNHVSTLGPDGQKLAAIWDKDTVRVWDVASGKVLYDLKEIGTAIRCLAFSPDGKRIVTGAENKVVKLWDTATGKPMYSLTAQPLFGETGSHLAFSADGRQLTARAGSPPTLRIWDTTPLVGKK